MDRLARNLDDLRALVQGLTPRGVRVEFVKESLPFTGEDSPMANLMMPIVGALAGFERYPLSPRRTPTTDSQHVHKDFFKAIDTSAAFQSVLAGDLLSNWSCPKLSRGMPLFSSYGNLATVRANLVHRTIRLAQHWLRYIAL